MIKNLVLIAVFFCNLGYAKNNKLFWDGSDWNRVKKNSDYNINTEFIIQKGLLRGSVGWQTFFILENMERGSKHC